MERNPALENIAIVLVEPLYAGNIGSTARAMKNMWLSDLRLVSPPLDRQGEAVQMATCAKDLLESAKKYFSLEEAIADCQYVYGTTARLGGWRKGMDTPRNSVKEILELAASNRVAILFGSEDRGLSNEQIRLCNSLISIPTNPEAKSLNISQAVLVLCYELFTAPNAAAETLKPKLADVAQVNSMFEEMKDVLCQIGVVKPGDPEYWLMPLRRLFGRTGLLPIEVKILRGIAHQIRWIYSKAFPDGADSTALPPMADESETSKQ